MLSQGRAQRERGTRLALYSIGAARPLRCKHGYEQLCCAAFLRENPATLKGSGAGGLKIGVFCHFIICRKFSVKVDDKFLR